MTAATTLREAVNAACRAGFSLIPVAADAKVPAFDLLPHNDAGKAVWEPFQHRRPTKDELRAWFSTPGRNLGIVCGKVSGGLAVLDIDAPKLAEELVSDNGLKATTTLVRTPHDGLHIWVIETDAVSRSGPLVPGVADLKAEGGYVLAPPSRLEDGDYRFVTNHTILRVSDARAWAIETLGAFGVEAPEGPHEPLDVPATLQGVPEGQRDEDLFRLASKLRRADVPLEVAQRLVLEAAANCTPPFPEDDALAKVQSAYSRYPAGEEVQPTRDPYIESRVGQGLELISLADLRSRFSADVRWIVAGYLARGELVFLAGAGGSLKSWTVAHLAAAIDGGFPWLGAFEVKAERVLFVEQERAGNLLYQLQRIEVGERTTLGSDRLRIVAPCDLPLSEPEAQDALKAAVTSFNPDVVIINALRDVLGRANENSPTEMAALLRVLGRLAEASDCCIVILDHFNKAGMAGVVRGSMAHGGTAQKYNEADSVLIAERPRDEMGKGEGPATLSVTKRRSGDPGNPFAVSVTDTPDGGVLVRAETDVKRLSAIAQLVYDALTDGSALVEDLVERTNKTRDNVKKGLGELRNAGLVESEGEDGKAHTYRRTDEPTRDSHIESRVGLNGLKPEHGSLVRFAVEQLGLSVIEPP